MFFKRIELVGFKSFATKTRIELLPGVTVVVGPNGCGKSNILDAIRWVLGNQSARSLRGKRMQDVIFSGSASFKPLGLAQVTLTLDNGRRTINMDYDEIQITRRLYRTGESEYLINKVPCRLRDIQDLFLGTGIGTSSYSILEQGKVDQIINAKPLERRFIFEEAAGISKFRVRKLEALRKLERTTQDLKRLADLIDEIGRHVARLKRQAGAAQRHRRLKGELRAVEMELAVVRSASLRSEIGIVGGEARSMRDRAEGLATDHAREAAAEQTGHDEAEAIGLRLTETSERLFEMRERIAALNNQADRVRDRVQTDRERLASLDEDFAELGLKQSDLERRGEELGERMGAAADDLRRAEEQYRDKDSSYAELAEQVETKKHRMEEMAAETIRHRETVSRCDTDVRMAELVITGHEESRVETQEEIARLSETLAGQKDRQSLLVGEIKALQGRLDETKSSLTALEAQQGASTERVDELAEELDSTRRDLHQRQARLAVLLELKKSFEGFVHGVREVMQAADRGELKGILGPLAGLIASSADYEATLEAALGPALQAVVTESGAAARKAMQLLVEGKHGRATFLPLELASQSATPEALESILELEDVLGHAPALITCDERIRPVVDALLAATVLVRDWETAERLAPRFPALTLLTLGGETIEPSGARTGGTLEPSRLLGREREIHELTEAVARLAERESLLARDLEKARREIQGLGHRIDAVKVKLAAMELEKVNLDRDAETIGRTCEDAGLSLAQREEQLARLIKEIEDKQRIIEHKTSQKAEHRRLLEHIDSRLDHEREEARLQGEDFLSRGSELAAARAEIEKVRQRLEHLDEHTSALERERAAVASNRQARVDEQTRLLESVEQAHGRIERAMAEIEELSADRDRLEARLTEGQAESEQISGRLKQTRRNLERIARDEGIVRDELAEKEKRLVALETHLENIELQVREKFDRDLASIAAEMQPSERDAEAMEGEAAELRRKLERIGIVNYAALEEYNEQKERLDFLTTQREDLTRSKKQIESSIAQIDVTTKKLFHETFESVRTHFIEMFRRMFNGGKADLIIDQQGEDPLLDGGIEIYAQPPGKKLQSLSLMSGGEKAMTAIALLFGLFLHKPAPFAILDEIDAPLDDANVERFKNVVMEFALKTQFVIITHNKQTMELADVLYGVTMEESGVSKLVSVRFEQADQYLTPSG